MLDWLITNGTIIDGSGGAPFRGDIAITAGKIAGVAPHIDAPAHRMVNAGGAVVAPGFIDIHRHADAALFRPGFGEAELRQGITTIVNGNCGMSAAPCPPARRAAIQSYLRPVTGSFPEGVKFSSMAEYLNLLKTMPLPLNVAMLAGSGTLRAAACGFDPQLDDDALHILQSGLREAMDAGVVGVSVGLSYLPDACYTAETMTKALAPMAGSGLPLTVHVRGEGDILYDSVVEALDIARRLDVPLHVSHYKCIGKRNWCAVQQKTSRMLCQALDKGQRVSCDVYPWTAGSTQMACLLPPQVLEGGFSQAARRLADPAWRKLAQELMEQPADDFENIVHSMGWENITVAGVGSADNRAYIGRTVADIAQSENRSPYDVAFDLLREENFDVAMVDIITCEEDIEDILRLPFASIISDAIYPDSARPHPRNYANIPRALNHYVRGRGVLDLPTVVHKLTTLPATTLNLKGKGLLRPGYDADVVVFRPEEISCAATSLQPEQFACGMRLVLVNGQAAAENDTLLAAGAGRVVRRV